MYLTDAGFEAAAPPEQLSEPQKALWWLKKGGFRTGQEWDRAHAICQKGEGKREYDHVHALTHWIEGDRWNSDYWYGQVGVERVSEDPETEWTHIVTSLTGETA